MKETIEELSAEDIRAFRCNRKNNRESNHPYGERSFMEIALSGSKKLQASAGNHILKLDGTANEEK